MAQRFGDPRLLALLSALVLFRLLLRGFSDRDLREHVASLLGLPLEPMMQGKMTYDLRRLHGMIARIPQSHRYRVTQSGFRAAVLITRAPTRLFRHGLGPRDPPRPTPLRVAIGASKTRSITSGATWLRIARFAPPTTTPTLRPGSPRREFSRFENLTHPSTLALLKACISWLR